MRARRVATLAGGLLLALGVSGASRIEVEILSPAAGVPLFGEVEVVVRVDAPEPVKQVEVRVDDRAVARLRHPPYRAVVNVGQANREHRIQVIAHGLFGARGEATLTAPRIAVNEEISVDLFQLYVTVSSSGGRLVTGLEAEDFEVVEHGFPQPIATFARGDLPISAVLLVDSSESMEGVRLLAALDGARTFASALRGGDEARVLLFSDRLLRATPFTGDPEELFGALRGARAAGGTAINDHLYMALNLLDRRLGRPVVVLLSDGVDVTSLLPMQQVLWKVRRSQAILYWLRLLKEDEDPEAPPSFVSAWRTVEENRTEYELLRTAIDDSGGRILNIRWIGELDRAFGSVLQELRGQYILGYSPPDRDHDGRWKTLQVRVRGRGFSVRSRGGYLDE